MEPLLRDRSEAGSLLAKKLAVYADALDVLVLALPRGGVPVAYEITSRLHLPLDVLIVRKLGFPDNEEYAMGAISINNIFFINPEAAPYIDRTDDRVQAIIKKEQQELIRRNKRYRDDRPMPDLTQTHVILVDDGVATGSSMKAAISVLKQMNAKTIILAVPVLPVDTLMELQSLVNEVVYLSTPEPFTSISYWYENFPQTDDAEVIYLLHHSDSRQNGKLFRSRS
ncbi:MAG: phosphoribosyltransferase [Legionellales bacterium]|nr:phosphoribosyltransferase [Legionellales bacterium]